jgi:uncharacterized protein YhhL (DUF1145 family)
MTHHVVMRDVNVYPHDFLPLPISPHEVCVRERMCKSLCQCVYMHLCAYAHTFVWLCVLMCVNFHTSVCICVRVCVSLLMCVYHQTVLTVFEGIIETSHHETSLSDLNTLMVILLMVQCLTEISSSQRNETSSQLVGTNLPY